MHVRRKRKRKALVSDTALSVSKVQAIDSYEEVSWNKRGDAKVKEEDIKV
jgi:hypothetical protein